MTARRHCLSPRLLRLEDRTVPTTGGTVTGFAFVDSNLNGQYDSMGRAGEQFIPDLQIYADLNANGQLDPGEPSGMSPGARFEFAADGVYVIRCAPLPFTNRTSPEAVAVNVAGGAFVGAEFGFDVTLNADGAQELFAVGSGEGGAPRVQVLDADGSVRFDFLAYDARFHGGVRVATADVTGDTTEDIVTAAGPGGGPHVKVFDGRTGNLVREWMAYDTTFAGGVYVAAWRGHNAPQGIIVTGAGAGGGPHVREWYASNGEPFNDLLAYDQQFRGGVTVALADFNGDMTFPEIITGAGPGGGPHVKVYDGQNLQLTNNFFAYEPEFRGGVFVSAMDANHDGQPDIVTGAGAGGGPLVKVFDWYSQQLIHAFFAYDVAFRGGVRVGATTRAHQFNEDIAVGAGPGGGPHVRILITPNLQDDGSFFAFDPSFTGGIYIG